jgi:hypothetical protein
VVSSSVCARAIRWLSSHFSGVVPATARRWRWKVRLLMPARLASSSTVSGWSRCSTAHWSTGLRLALSVTGTDRSMNCAWPPALDSTIDTHLAAMAHLIHESELNGINAELPRFVKRLTDRAVADGRGADSYAAMIDQFRKPSS